MTDKIESTQEFLIRRAKQNEGIIKMLRERIKELETRGALDLLTKNKQQQKEIQELNSEITQYKTGRKGGCLTCEPVGELNRELDSLAAHWEMRATKTALENKELRDRIKGLEADKMADKTISSFKDKQVDKAIIANSRDKETITKLREALKQIVNVIPIEDIPARKFKWIKDVARTALKEAFPGEYGENN